jgi:hypothetical protein
MWTAAQLSRPSETRDWEGGIPGHTLQVPTQYWASDPVRQWTVAPNWSYFRDQRAAGSSNVVWVLPFHDACWKVLETASQRVGIPIDLQAL